MESMNQRPEWLLDYADNTHSQMGEDGVIAKILETIPETDRWCVEFGAWDGKYLSNACRLIEEKDYNAILIEGDAAKFSVLKSNYTKNDKVFPVNAFVGYQKKDGLDTILPSYDIPRNFDFLSIDIDGNDYHVWKAIKKYRPKVVCVEFNPTIPSEVFFVQSAKPNVSQGCSILALDKLSREKGYELVCVLRYNAFFVDQLYFPKFRISNNAPHVLRKDLSFVTWIFTGYDGSIHLAGCQQLPWHRMNLYEQKMQLLPQFLQHYPDNYSKSQKILFKIFKNFRKLFRKVRL
jgi:hypothetical protein